MTCLDYLLFIKHAVGVVLFRQHRRFYLQSFGRISYSDNTNGVLFFWHGWLDGWGTSTFPERSIYLHPLITRRDSKGQRPSRSLVDTMIMISELLLVVVVTLLLVLYIPANLLAAQHLSQQSMYLLVWILCSLIVFRKYSRITGNGSTSSDAHITHLSSNPIEYPSSTKYSIFLHSQYENLSLIATKFSLSL